MATNLNTTLYERQYNAVQERSEAPAWFRHLPPALPATSLPDYPGWGTGAIHLNSYERAEVDSYLANPTDAVLASLRLPDAIAKAGEFKTYFATPAFQAWNDANRVARKAQWQLFTADALINNKAADSPSSDSSGTGGGTPPDPALPPGTNVP